MPMKKVDLASLALNLDGCRFGSPPTSIAQQRQEEDDDDPQRQRRRGHTTTNNNNDRAYNDNNDSKLSPLSTHHSNYKAQYNNNYRHHNSSYSELTSPLGTTYRREGLSIGHNFLRFQGSTLSDNFNANQLDVLECIGRGVCSSVWKARRKLKRSNDDVGEELLGGEQVLLEEDNAESFSSALIEQQHAQIEDRKDGDEEYYALKVFAMRDPQKRTMLIRELKLLCSTTTTTTTTANNNINDNSTTSSQECECLVELQGAFLDELDGTVTLVLEYMNFGSLTDLLSPSSSSSSSSTSGRSMNPIMPEYAIASIAYQMIWGLAYLHHEGVLHRDIKPANVLLSEEGRVKLADFGIVSTKETDNGDYHMNVTMIGTTRYMSPERLRCQAYNKQADIWSLGLVLLECTRGGGNSPFEHISSIVELVQTLDDCTTMEEYIPDGTSEGLREILVGCLNHCPEKRMPADVLIGSPWFELNGIECVGDAVWGMKRHLATLK